MSAKSVAEREHEIIAAAFAQAFSDAPQSKDLDELQVDFERVTKGIDMRPPVTIVSFEA